MKFAVSKGETEISELAGRIFEIKGRGAAATSKQVEAALLKANQHLGYLTKIKPGTLIVIPEAAENPPLRGPQTPGAGADTMGQLKFALEDLAGAIERAAKSDEESLAGQTEALKDRELRDFAAQSPEAKEQLGKLSEALKNRSKEIKANAAAQKDGLKQLVDSVDKLPH
jgi:hypothetical protein